MSLSHRHSERPYSEPGEKLGDRQFEQAGAWEASGHLALVGMGVEPGLADVFARYAADHLFSSIEEVGVRDGANLTVDGYEFAPSFSLWTTIEECLNPPIVWEKGRGWYTTPPFSEPETFELPEGIGPVECVNVEHEEVLLVPRWVDAGRMTFKYGLGDEFINVLQVLHAIGLDRTEKVRVGGVEVSPRDVVAACLPDPAELGDRMHGKTCAGTWVKGTGKDGRPREVYLYHVDDNAECMALDGVQAGREDGEAWPHSTIAASSGPCPPRSGRRPSPSRASRCSRSAGGCSSWSRGWCAAVVSPYRASWSASAPRGRS
jgi:saccharopine dehydrogenase (NAD+, L-lysine-forming)